MADMKILLRFVINPIDALNVLFEHQQLSL